MEQLGPTRRGGADSDTVATATREEIVEICREGEPCYIDCYHAKSPLFWKVRINEWLDSQR